MSEADSFDWLPALLVCQGVLAAADSWLSPRPLAAARDALYAALFLGFAWLAWQGSYAWMLGALLAAQMAIGVLDEHAGALHALELLNLGALGALLVPALLALSANATELAPAHHGWMSWALTALGAVAAWNAASRRRRRRSRRV